MTVRYIVGWNNEGAAGGNCSLPLSWDARVDFFAYKIGGYEVSKA